MSASLFALEPVAAAYVGFRHWHVDGGRLFFVLLGAIFRIRLTPQVEAAVHAVGFVLLLLLLVVVSIADIRRVVGG